MKLQTTALIKQIIIDGVSLNVEDQLIIDLELSAIDAGGGFKDPIVDFSFSVPSGVCSDGNHKFTVSLSDPDKKDNEITFNYEGTVKQSNGEEIVVNGRLKEDQLSKDLVAFIMKRMQ